MDFKDDDTAIGCSIILSFIIALVVGAGLANGLPGIMQPEGTAAIKLIEGLK